MKVSTTHLRYLTRTQSTLVKTITVTIDKKGVPSIEAHGFQGGACKLATKPIEDALSNGKTDVVVEKPEMHLATEQTNQIGLTH